MSSWYSQALDDYMKVGNSVLKARENYNIAWQNMGRAKTLKELAVSYSIAFQEMVKLKGQMLLDLRAYREYCIAHIDNGTSPYMGEVVKEE